jgi:hypothetical protein
MTPHRHWVQNYSPLRMPIRLADNSIIYSSGVGTVIFNPVSGGKALQPVEFSRVLHVPSLQNNLLSCLYLTKHKNIQIRIDSVQMDFMRDGRTLFCAPIGSNCLLFSLVQLNLFLSLLTGFLHSLSLPHSGIVAVVIITWWISQRCTRIIW